MSDPTLFPVNDAFLLINPGTASLKSAIFEEDAGSPGQSPVWRGSVTGIGRAGGRWQDSEGGAAMLPEDAEPFPAAFAYLLARALAWLGDQPVRAIGYRLSHAGDHPGEPVLLDDAVLDWLDSVPAPRYQKDALHMARMLAARWPGVAQVASFDAWFHRTLPLAERMLPLPVRFWEAGLRRSGCHGLSYEFLATALPRRFGHAAHGRVIAAHLGHSASVCGMLHLRSVAVSQGMTGMDGLMTGTGAGLLPPDAMRRLAQEIPGREALAALLDEQSGLLGVSGESDDPAVLLRREGEGGPAGERANAALSLYVRQVVREIGAIAAVLGGLDILVFTGGVGEHHAPLRQRICDALQWLGVTLDPSRNERALHGISATGSRVIVAVEPAREEWVMARDCMLLTAVTCSEAGPRGGHGAPHGSAS